MLQFAPALLRWRAHKLEKEFGGQAFFVSKHDLNRSTSFIQVLKLNLKRPFGIRVLSVSLRFFLTSSPYSIPDIRTHRLASVAVRRHYLRDAVRIFRRLPYRVPGDETLLPGTRRARISRRRLGNPHRHWACALEQQVIYQRHKAQWRK